MNNKVINIVKMMAVLMGLFVCSSISAQNGNVREETARQVGLNFLRLKDGNPQSNMQLTRVNAVRYPNLYVYNTSENGFIVVASDNRMEPILAYSDEGTFDKDDVAPGANFWFEMYEYAIDSLVRNNVREVDEKITRKWEDLINGVMPEPERSGNYPSSCGKLIMTYWGQGDSISWNHNYNMLCPWYIKNNTTIKAITGCAATALAQVLNYYMTHFNLSISRKEIRYSFRHNGNQVLSLYGPHYSEQASGCYLPPRKTYSIGGWNDLSGMDRIAKMMLDCGLAIDMTYGTYASGAQDLDVFACPNESSIEKALRLYFGFPKAFGKVRNNDMSQWSDTLKKYISHNVPILYGGFDSSDGAHEFICDGYDENLFHFNFGWNGGGDGYYSINNPQGYALNQSAVFLRPVPDEEKQTIIWNDVIEMGDSLSRTWCGGTVTIRPGTSPSSNANWVIVYNSPGSYSLRNECNDENRILLWNVKVSSPLITIPKYAEICRRDDYDSVFYYLYQTNMYGTENDTAFAYYNLSRNQTDFVGTKTFYEYYLNKRGERVAVCKLNLTTIGAITEDTIADTVDRCSLIYPNKPKYNYIYLWKIGGDTIFCHYSGRYEYAINNPFPQCDDVHYLDLTILGDEIVEDTTVCKIDSIYYHGKWITEYDDNPYKVCDNNVFYVLYANFTDSISINVSDTICVKDVPYTWRDTTFSSWTTPGSYHAEIPISSNCCCDTTFVLDIQINEDCCIPDTACLKDKLAEGDKSVPSNIETIYYGLKHYFDYRSAMNGFLVNVLRGVTWQSIEERNTFWNLFQSLLDSNTGMMSESAMQQLIVTNPYNYITEDYITNLVERYNRSVMYWNEGQYSVWYLPQGYNPDFIEYDTAAMNKAYEAYDYAIAHGFSDVKAMYDNAYELLAAEVDNIQSAVCAHVTVKFTQKMTMTREAFNGTLQIFNGHESIPMQDIMVDFRVTDPQGNDCTNLFQIDTLSLDQITGISGDGSLAAQTNGTALVQFIPTKNAAPTEPKVYSFGGSFSFIDPFTGEGLTYPLYPVEITVNPSPDLYVDYFMQRNILGDDALTTDVVEPSVPAELGVIIHNQGAGEAKNVTLETAEPQIIDNEHGLAIDFAMYGASFNGSPRQLGLMEIPFGNIGSGQTAVGEWLFTSSLLGHFISYEAHVIHNSSYGNPDLSLVSHLDIHELIHPIYAYGNLDDGINDFLVNDVLDAYDQPDSIYFSHGGRTAVGIVDNISFDHYVEPQDIVVILTINPSRIGWNYGVTEDPGRDNYDLVSCTRNFDGQVIPLNNVWQTFVTIPDGGDPVYENKLHIVDTLSNDVQDFTYTLVYSLKNNQLDVLEITGIPESYIDYPLESFTVRFNEAIIDSTFTYEDMTLKCQNGPNLMDSTIVITKVNDSIYDVNISGLTNETGLYVLNVSTLNIKDSRGYYGYKGKQATWVQVIEDYTQTTEFAQGWTWWSTYIEQNGIDGLTMLEQGLGANGHQIKSQTDYVTNFGTSWMGMLNSINNEETYMVKSNGSCVVELTGTPALPANHPITIDPGWTWIGYPSDHPTALVDAFANFSPSNGDLVKSQSDWAMYSNGNWIGLLLNITPGMGLMYESQSTTTSTLLFPENGRGTEVMGTVPRPSHWTNDIHAYPNNMTVLATVELEGLEIRSEDYELSVFADGECRGSARLQFVEPLNRYIAFLTVSGEDATELHFGLYNTETNEEYYDAEESLIFTVNATVGEPEDVFMVHFRGGTGMDELSSSVQVYPNPVNGGERFSIGVNAESKAPIRVEIVNAMGVETLRATSAQMPAMLTAPSVAGVYTLRITVEGKGTVVRKLLVK